MSLSNTSLYKRTLRRLFESRVPCENNYGIAYEIIGYSEIFKPVGVIDGTSLEYIEHELDWYNSQDLNINGHKGIENNKVWKKCATEDGHVNSNYGWCIFSKENGEQFENAVKAIVSDINTKQACMYYTRPSIHKEFNDGIHARRDMICTCYTSTLLRCGVLHHNVHMRSNDVWYGLRNDLAWQQHVAEKMVDRLRSEGLLIYNTIIHWFADSLHLYERNVMDARKMIEE